MTSSQMDNNWTLGSEINLDWSKITIKFQFCWQLLRKPTIVINVITNKWKIKKCQIDKSIKQPQVTNNKQTHCISLFVPVVSIKRKRERKSWRHLKRVKIGLHYRKCHEKSMLFALQWFFDFGTAFRSCC
jgi:hypothetical protein